MSWSALKTTPSLEGKSRELRLLFAEVANASLTKGLSEDEATFAGLAAVRQKEKSEVKKYVKPSVPSHLQAILNARDAYEGTLTNLQDVLNASSTLPLTEENNASNRGVAKAEFNSKGQLVLDLENGEKLITKGQALNEYIEQHVSILNQDGGLTEPLPSLQFNTTAGVSVVEGQLAWNQADGTLDVGMQGGNVVQQVGLENYFRVKNQTGSTITNGTVVMVDGAVGNSGRLLCTPALASVLTPSIYTMGIATETILNGEDGFVTQFGIVRGIDTRGITEGETWVDGDILYVSPITAGKLTKVIPTAPSPKIIVAMVVHAHSNGQLFVRPTFSEAVGELNDVQITSIQDRDVLTYSAADQTWKNSALPVVEKSPEFTYTTGVLTRVDYDSGNYKLFTYTSGVLTQLDYVVGSVTTRKTFNYNLDGSLASITQTII
jgi:hypothetical protein